MKRTLITFALIVVAFFLGWFAHLAFSYDPQSGLQWQFVAAAQRGDLGSVQRYFQQGARIDERPSYANRAVFGFPALLQASDGGQPEVVEWLLAHGANPNQQSSDSNPLEAAEHRIADATKTAAILKAHGAKNLYPK